MSVEALLAEVHPTTGLTTILEAAEAILLNERPIYSDVKPQTSHAGGAKHEGGHHKNNRGGSQDKDKVTAAIDEAKKAATHGRRNHRQSRASHKSESGEVAALRHEIDAIKLDNAALHKKVDELLQLVLKANIGGASAPAAAQPAPAAAPAPAPAAPAADDDFDLFGSDDEEDDAEKLRLTEERLKAYAEKKSKKPGPIAKSNIIYDVKPWDDTINTDDIEAAVRSIQMEGLVWGAAKKVPVAFGIVKLQICCVVEDEKVSSDALEEAITGFEDLVQSVDVVAFNKV